MNKKKREIVIVRYPVSNIFLGQGGVQTGKGSGFKAILIKKIRIISLKF